jgi:outer membrane immunogenic protein
MKKVMLGAVALVVVIGVVPAFAADLPTYTKARPLPPVVSSWTGCYVGGNVGADVSNSNNVSFSRTDTGAGGVGSGFAAITGLRDQPLSSNTSVIGGGQVGCNWQNQNFVWGVETDIQGLDVSRSFQFSNPATGNIINVNSRLDWLGTVRGRVGITATPALLLYATGGFAYAESKVGLETIFPTAGPPQNGCFGAVAGGVPTCATNNRMSAGWTIGAGGEYAISSQWSAKLEYLYYDLGRHSSTVVYNYAPFTSSLTDSVRDTGNIVRVGVNYHFSGPVVAKY